MLMGSSVHSWNVQREFPRFLRVQIDVSDLSNSVSEIMIKLWSCLACGKVPTDAEEKEASETMTYEGGRKQKWDEVASISPLGRNDSAHQWIMFQTTNVK